MDSRGLSTHKIDRCLILCGIAVALTLFGCMAKPGVEVIEPSPVTVPPPAEKRPAPPAEEPSDHAQVRAAAAMVRQGRQHLTRGEPDAAIRILERSVTLDSTSGQNYYYLAEAWLMKKNTRQAREFNRLAGVHLARDTSWEPRIRHQRDRIDALEK